MQPFDQLMSIYIPRMYANISFEKVAKVFHELDLGLAHSADFHFYESKSGEHLKSAFVFFSEMYDTTQTKNFIAKLENNEAAKIVYNDPKYWVCLKNNNQTPSMGGLSCENEVLRLRINSLEDQMLEMQSLLKNIMTKSPQTYPQDALKMEDDEEILLPFPNHPYHPFDNLSSRKSLSPELPPFVISEWK